MGVVVRLGEILRNIVESPLEIVRAAVGGSLPGQAARGGAGDPAVVIHTAVADHFEVLRLVLRGDLHFY